MVMSLNLLCVRGLYPCSGGPAAFHGISRVYGPIRGLGLARDPIERSGMTQRQTGLPPPFAGNMKCRGPG